MLRLGLIYVVTCGLWLNFHHIRTLTIKIYISTRHKCIPLEFGLAPPLCYLPLLSLKKILGPNKTIYLSMNMA